MFFEQDRLFFGSTTGNLDYAYAAAQEAYEPTNLLDAGNDQDFAWLYTPKYRVMRADPRFLWLMKKVGLFDYWITSKTHPEFCDAAEDRDSEICFAIRKAQAEGN